MGAVVACCRNDETECAVVAVCQSEPCKPPITTVVERGEDLDGSESMLNHMLLQAAKDDNVTTVLGMLRKRADVETRLPFRMATHMDPGEFQSGHAKGMTPLMYAAQGGNQISCRVLLAARADVKAGDEDCMQPLHFAASSGCIETCKLLLDARADPYICDDAGDAALAHVAASAMKTRRERENWQQLFAERAQ